MTFRTFYKASKSECTTTLPTLLSYKLARKLPVYSLPHGRLLTRFSLDAALLRDSLDHRPAYACPCVDCKTPDSTPPIYQALVNRQHVGCETFASSLTILTFIISRRLSHWSGLAEQNNSSPPRLLSAFDGPTTYVEDTGNVPQPSDESSICIVDFVWTHGATRCPSSWLNFTCSVCSSCRGQGCGHRVHCWFRSIPERPALGYTQICHTHANDYHPI